MNTGTIINKEFWKATGIRCLRSFISVILGAQSTNLLVTEIDWKTTLIAAASTTFWIFLACIMAGLPEVRLAETVYDYDNDVEDVDEEEEDEEDDE